MTHAETPQLGDYQSAGFMWVGVQVGGAIRIPPKTQAYHMQSTCSFDQLPAAGVNVFAYINHAHLLGRKLWTTLERDKKYARDVGCDTAYDFDLQQIKTFAEPVKVFADDVLRANCVYDSTSRTEVTKGGDETTNEMCINFLVYYPEVDGLERCLNGNPKIMAPSCAGQHKCCDASNGTVCEEMCKGSGSFGPGWLVAHLILMVFSWGLMIPAGAAFAALRDKCDAGGTGTWFKWHRGVQSVGLLLATAGAVVAIASVGTHFDTLHKIVGILVMLLGWLQPMNALFRPHTPQMWQVKSAKRQKWEYLHKGCGRFTLLAAVFNMALGATAARNHYGSRTLSIVAWVWFSLGFLLVLIVIWTGTQKKTSGGGAAAGGSTGKEGMRVAANSEGLAMT